MQKLLMAAGAVLMLGVTGCVGPWQVRIAQNETQLSYVPKAEDVDVVGPVNAEGENDYLFCLIPIQEDGGVNRLVQSMRQSAHADAILNLSIEQRAKWVFFYCWNKVSVSGLAVRFKRYRIVAPQDVFELPIRSDVANTPIPATDCGSYFDGETMEWRKKPCTLPPATVEPAPTVKSSDAQATALQKQQIESANTNTPTELPRIISDKDGNLGLIPPATK